MNILEAVANTFSPRLPDGRFVFRPWGARGPCYLLTARQRSARAWIQLAYYALGFGLLWSYPPLDFTAPVIGAFVAFVLLNHALFWLFSLGLPKTDVPAPMTPVQRRQAMQAHSRALGRPLLWIAVLLSWLFVLTVLVMILVLGVWLAGLLCLVFFGAYAVLFTWQLKLARTDGDT